MLLKLLIGEAGSGKTTQIHKAFLQRAMESVSQRTILIVPEQITLLEQKRLIADHPGKGLMGADVLSFHRLAHRVLAEKGEKDLVILDEVGKSMLLYRLAQELAPQMVYYGGSVHSQGFLQRLKSLFGEMSQYEVTQEDLEKAAESAAEGSSLKMKLQDLCLIRQHYDEELLKYGEISEKLLDRLVKAIPESDFLKDAHIYVDDFYGFTPQQMQVLNGLIHRAAQVTISLTLPEQEARQVDKTREDEKGDLFDTSRKTLSMLLDTARATRVPVQPLYTHYDRKDCLSHTAREFFKIPPKAWLGEKNNIELYAATGCREEVRRMFEKIVYLVREKGYEYRQIGVALGDIAAYQGLIRQYAEEFNIPIFMDETSNVMAHPFVRMIRSLLQMLRSRCSYDTLFSFLKSGFTPFSREQLDTLDNLALERGWRGFNRAAQAMKECAAGSANEEAILLYVERLGQFWEMNNDQTAQEWCRHLQWFLEATGAEYLLEKQAKRLRSDGFFLQEAQCSQIYTKVMQVLERIAEMMPDTVMNVEGFHGILSAGLMEIKLGMLPPALDQVTVGDMDRSRFHNLKALFILGFGEGSFPKVTQDQGLLLEKERGELAAHIQLAPDGLRQLYDQQFRLYILLSAATELLYVSYDASPEKGEAKSPSLYWSRFLQILGRPAETSQDILTLAEPEFQQWCESEEKDAQLQKWFQRHGYSERISRLREAGRLEEESISPEMAAKIWQPESWELSVTRMEQYARCPYAHFLRYGLSLQERKLFQASFADDGRILHGILEGAGLLLQQFYDKNTDAATIQKLIEELFKENEASYEQYQDNSRYRYYWRKLQKTAMRALASLKSQVEAGSFRPEYFEWGFGSGKGKSLPPMEIPLSSGQKLRMSGIIDRVDVLQEDGVTYVRIIDYKSGSTEFSESDIEDGVSLQLPVYMEAVTEGLRAQGRTVKPAGMFYFHLTPQIQKVDKPMSEEEAEEKAKKGARLSGVAVNDPAVLDGMAKDPQQLQNILPVRMTKSGKVHGSDVSKLRTAQELANLSQYTAGKIAQLAEEELSGCIRQYPYRKDSYSVCSYCVYREACSFDIRQEGALERWAVKRRKDEFWKQIQEVALDDGNSQS